MSGPSIAGGSYYTSNFLQSYQRLLSSMRVTGRLMTQVMMATAMNILLTVTQLHSASIYLYDYWETQKNWQHSGSSHWQWSNCRSPWRTANLAQWSSKRTQNWSSSHWCCYSSWRKWRTQWATGRARRLRCKSWPRACRRWSRVSYWWKRWYRCPVVSPWRRLDVAGCTYNLNDGDHKDDGVAAKYGFPIHKL